MIQKTTPTLTFTVTGFDLTGYDSYVYIKQGDVLVTKEGSVSVEDEASTVTAILTAEDTLSFMGGSVNVQLWATNGTDRVASEIFVVDITPILDKELP